MRRFFRWPVVVAATMLMTLGCKPRQDSTAAVKDLAANPGPGNGNIALLIGAPDCAGKCSTYLDGVAKDMDAMGQIFKDFGFEVRRVWIKDGKGGGAGMSVLNKAGMLAETRRAAQDAGAKGTLIWYYTGHGDENNGALAVDGTGMMIKEVGQNIILARQGNPLKRLVLMSDSCYSGALLTGRNNILGMAPKTAEAQRESLERGKQNFLSGVDQMEDATAAAAPAAGNTPATGSDDGTGLKLSGTGRLREQIIAIAAASPTKTAGDTNIGGIYSAVFKLLVDGVRQSGENPTIAEFLDMVKTSVDDLQKDKPEEDRQKPMSMFDPPFIGSESMLPSSPTGQVMVGPTATTGQVMVGPTATTGQVMIGPTVTPTPTFSQPIPQVSQPVPMPLSGGVSVTIKAGESAGFVNLYANAIRIKQTGACRWKPDGKQSKEHILINRKVFTLDKTENDAKLFGIWSKMQVDTVVPAVSSTNAKNPCTLVVEPFMSNDPALAGKPEAQVTVTTGMPPLGSGWSDSQQQWQGASIGVPPKPVIGLPPPGPTADPCASSNGTNQVALTGSGKKCGAFKPAKIAKVAVVYFTDTICADAWPTDSVIEATDPNGEKVTSTFGSSGKGFWVFSFTKKVSVAKVTTTLGEGSCSYTVAVQ